MAPRVDSPTNLEAVAMEEEEEDILDTGSLTSRPLRRVPTPMGQSHTTSHSREEDSLFDKAEKSDKGSPKSVSSGEGAVFFGADFEALSNLKDKAHSAATRGRSALHEMVYGSSSSSPSVRSSPQKTSSRSTKQKSPRKGNSASSGGGSSNSSGNNRALSLFDAIAKPFVACSAQLPEDIDNAVGEIVAKAATAVVQKSPSEDYSKNYSYDDEYDEARQLRRMTSWNTLETANTAASYITEGTETPAQTLYDDDGNLIPNILMDLTKEMRQKRTRRKRVVKFDYPPISSLKECPRPDPVDLPNLYFTEDELNQIEDDRISTNTADDVEVVCVSSSESTESQQPPYESRPLRELAELDESDTSSLLHQHDVAHLSSLQQKQRRYGRGNEARPKRLFGRSPLGKPGILPPRHPMTSDARSINSASDLADDASIGNLSQSSVCSQQSRNSRSPPPTSKRLIKSVHIFMRERSRERSAEI